MQATCCNCTEKCYKKNCTKTVQNKIKLRRAGVDGLNNGGDNFIQQTEKMFRVEVDVLYTVDLVWVYLQVTESSALLDNTHNTNRNMLILWKRPNSVAG